MAARSQLMDAAIRREPIHVMTKPIGPICNIDCEYCFYLKKKELYPRTSDWKMSDETLASYVEQYIDAHGRFVPEVTFAWQGGEPTLMGIEFFERAFELQQKFKRPGQKILNAIQTNGVILDEAWCRFLRDRDFLVGLSIDGPADLHDRYRLDLKGQGTFAAVRRALTLLQKFEVEFNTLVVVNRTNGDHGKRVYQYLRDSGARFIQFIPLVERSATDAVLTQFGDYNLAGESQVSNRSVKPEQFGDFLIEIFDHWVQRDVGRVFVQIFDQALSAWLGIEPSLCVFRRQCGKALAVEHNGDLYSCDHFVDPDHFLGNIGDQPLLEMVHSEAQQAFGREKESTLPETCLQCEVRFVCNGECPKNRFVDTGDPRGKLNYLCQGYRKFFNHISPQMKQMAELVQAKRSPSEIMQTYKLSRVKRSESLPSTPPVPGSGRTQSQGRNDLCACGSGKKYKKCCMR